MTFTLCPEPGLPIYAYGEREFNREGGETGLILPNHPKAVDSSNYFSLLLSRLYSGCWGFWTPI